MNIKETASFLQDHDNFLLLTHIRPDGDTVGSAAALCQALRDMGKTAYVLANDGLTATYAPYAAPYTAPEGYTYDTVVAVDIASRSLLVGYAGPIDLCIDHHPSNEGYAGATCLEADSAACGEVVYQIIRELTAITPAIALPLYVAISTDCGGFQYGNTTARTHRIAAELMELVDVRDVNKALFRTKSRVRMAMESRMVADMEFYDAGRVVVMKIPLSLRQEMHATEADIEELSALAAMVEGTDCGVTLRELRPGAIKVSLRTGPQVNASHACKLLGGGGHFAAAGATVEGTMEEVKAKVLAAISEVTK